MAITAWCEAADAERNGAETATQQQGHGVSTLAQIYLAMSAMSRMLRRNVMDHNRVEGTKHEVKGATKEIAGKVTGNKVKEATGNVEKNVGKAQKEVGKAMDGERKEEKKHRH